MPPTHHRPSRPASTRVGWPRHHRPPRPRCGPSVLHPESSIAPVHGPGRWVAGRLGSPGRPRGPKPSTPQRRRRVLQARGGSAPRRREGQCWSPPRTRQRSAGVRPPKRAGHLTPTMVAPPRLWAASAGCDRSDPGAGRPTASRACVPGLSGPWRLALIPGQARAGVGVCLGVSLAGEHGALLRRVTISRQGLRERSRPQKALSALGSAGTWASDQTTPHGPCRSVSHC